MFQIIKTNIIKIINRKFLQDTSLMSESQMIVTWVRDYMKFKRFFEEKKRN